MICKRGAILLFLWFWQNKLTAQDLEYSQFFNAPLYTNPAFAGVDEGPRFCLNYRNQWGALGNAYESYSVAYDQHLDAVGGGIGLMIVSDRQGDGLYTSNSAHGIYAYQVNLSRSFGLKAGASVSLIQKRVQSADLVFAENINPDNGSILPGSSSDLPDQPSRTLIDFGFGGLLYTRAVFAGLSIKHITSPDESMTSNISSPLPMRWSADLGFEAHSKSKTKTPVYFTPNLHYVQQAKFRQLDGGALLGIGVLYGGMYYRTAFTNGDALIFIAGLKKGVFKFGYSYDATVSGLKSETSGTHELALVINFHDSEKIRFKRNSRRFTTCPDIF